MHADPQYLYVNNFYNQSKLSVHVCVRMCVCVCVDLHLTVFVDCLVSMTTLSLFACCVYV